jgi:hypothetical protein
VYTGLKRTKKTTTKGTPVVSADGQARIVYRCANDEELAGLVQALAESFTRPATTYGQLFDAGNSVHAT